ncbi:TapB family protein [Pedobacter nyackensis]|uniref:DUF3108 domain-containing protein n=1 Tax=Pedobacter nyackensis TaxID=475255 RepID=A0A1W2EJY8_9SPHI|nr:hypothetical protein [Pedobacter nyackensis]SMD09925.1 hypothetical protein SAMN04488101_1138 [Pedobacter nyackensis]
MNDSQNISTEAKVKFFFAGLLMLSFISCNNSGTQTSTNADVKEAVSEAKRVHESSDDECGNSLLFKKGVKMHSATYNAEGKQTNKQIATVTKVYEEGAFKVAEIEIQSMDTLADDNKLRTLVYKCDGKSLFMDISGLLPKDNKAKVEGGGLSFPSRLSTGQSLPDTEYSMNMEQGGKKMKIVSHVTDRKVESQEDITIGTKTYAAYKISSVIKADIEIAGMTEQMKKSMEAMKEKMPKNKMLLWYAPSATVLKMEFYLGDKLVTRNEVTSIER